MPAAKRSSSAESLHDRQHAQAGASSPLLPPAGDTIRCGSRRWFLQTGTRRAGRVVAGGFAAHRAAAATSADQSAHGKSGSKKSVILFWLSGGPSHIDMWDPKPDAPAEIRGPYRRSTPASLAFRCASICR